MTKTAWVTGASRGLGEAIARRLAADGWAVVLSGRDRARLDALAAELGGQRVLAFDLDDPAAIAAAGATFAGSGGPLHALVNAGGVSARAALADADAPAVWARVLRTNLDGPFHVTRAALPHLADGGRVVNLASDLARLGMAAFGAYCASKHGLLGLTRALALELAPRGITVNAVCPGWVETAMAAQGFAEIAAAIGADPEDVRRGERDAVPLGRFATPAEVAAMTAFLLSDAAAMVTGQAWDLSGGSVMP